jgi:hypothetical protein
MTASVQRYLSAGILTIWGVMLAHFYVSGADVCNMLRSGCASCGNYRPDGKGSARSRDELVKVIGKVAFPVESGRRVPLVLAKNVTPCDPPEETFIY